jgi:cleavage stimulation factor subunit 3
MEYHANKDAKVATNVFELGLKTFADDADYACRYLDFLISTNDDTSAFLTACLVPADDCVRCQSGL